MAEVIQIFPKHVVEGLLANHLASLKESLDCVVYREMGEETKLTQVESIKATYSIALGDTTRVLEMLFPYTDDSLCEKHRFYRDLMQEFQERLGACSRMVGAKRLNHGAVIQFAREITEFLTAGHLVLHEDTNQDARIAVVQEYVGQCPGLAQRLPGRSKNVAMILDTSVAST